MNEPIISEAIQQDVKRDGLLSNIVRRLGLLENFQRDHKSVSHLSRKIIQIQHFETGAGNSGATAVPIDDTIPQNTEGDQYMSLAITPTNINNILYIDALGYFSTSAATGYLIMSLFKNTDANALASGISTSPTATYIYPVFVRYKMTAGVLVPITFKVRCGCNNPGTTTFNGFTGARKLGGVFSSYITITESLP